MIRVRVRVIYRGGEGGGGEPITFNVHGAINSRFCLDFCNGGHVEQIKLTRPNVYMHLHHIESAYWDRSEPKKDWVCHQALFCCAWKCSLSVDHMQ